MLSQTSNYTDNSQKFGLENEYIYTTKIVFALPFLEFCFNLFKIWLWKQNNSQIHKVDNTIMILTCHSMEQKALFPTKRHLRCLPQKKYSILFLLIPPSLEQYVTPFSTKIIGCHKDIHFSDWEEEA